jgi:ribosomal protein S6
LNNLFKSYFGYLGQSIKSKSIEAIASDELRTEYAKKFRSHNEVIAITTSVIEQYNNTPQKGKTPIEKYSENSHPSPIVPNQFDRAQLLPFKISKKIDRGQINIMRGTEKFEYQLPAHLFQIWNNKTVIVTHDNLQDGIYLFDKENENGIAFLMLKQKMHNSKAEQTENDIQGLNNNKGRLNGIQVKGRKQLEEIRDKAHNIDPEAYLKVSALTTPKSIIKELEQNANLRHLVEDQGVITNEMNRTVESFDITMSLKPSTKKTNPFTVKNNKLEIFDPTKLIEDDE